MLMKSRRLQATQSSLTIKSHWQLTAASEENNIGLKMRINRSNTNVV
jgi:hypothetical protein